MNRSAAPSSSWALTGERRLWLGLSSLAVLIGTAHALHFAWVTDDAYISFRYAENLVHGHGLVFNVGEHVEGYSNFLWTLWCALGFALGASPEGWSIGSGVIAFAATLALLAWFAGSRRSTNGPANSRAEPAHSRIALALPIAAWLGAAHRDWAIFATSGLESSLFTLLVVSGYLLLLHAEGRRWLAVAAGTVLAVATLTRPDGLIFAIVGGMYLITTSRRRVADTIAFGLPLTVILGPYALWKLSYYGDLFPNTYYAKSANRAWYSQGLVYVELYFRKYWVLALGVGACLATWALGLGRGAAPAGESAGRGEPRRPSWSRAAGLALAFGLVYTWYVARVGGDFMYARLLVPATPFYLILCELGLERLGASRQPLAAAAAVGAVAALAWTPYPFHGEGWVKGIVNEREFYIEHDRSRAREFGLLLRRTFEGLPIRMAFCGGQAILAYYSRAPLAIETATGLTDSVIAHQPLEGRGRVGHEKKTPVPYLISRRTHFWMYTGTLLSDTLARYIPLVPMRIDTLDVMVMTWDPPVVAALRRRGVRVADFPATLDEYIRTLPSASPAEVRAVYDKARRFYFDQVSDPAREAPFLARLRQAAR